MKYRVIYNPNFICEHPQCDSPFHFFMEIRFFGIWFAVKKKHGEILHTALPSEFDFIAKDLAPRMEKLRDSICYSFLGGITITIFIIAFQKGLL